MSIDNPPRPDLAMNLFHLHPDPERCAQYYVDSHVGKILIESCQMLSTAICETPGSDDKFDLEYFYKPCYANHPMNRWVRESYDNWYWTLQHALALSREFTYRWFTMHRTHYNCLSALLENDVNQFMFDSLPGRLTQFPLCMPEDYKFYDDPHWCYRVYYKFGKKHVHGWTRRDEPEWMEMIPSYEEIFYKKTIMK